MITIKNKFWTGVTIVAVMCEPCPAAKQIQNIIDIIFFAKNVDASWKENHPNIISFLQTITLDSWVGFPANENFREKMRKWILRKEAKTMQNFVEKNMRQCCKKLQKLSRNYREPISPFCKIYIKLICLGWFTVH